MIGFQSKAFTLLRAEYYGAAVLKFNSNKSFCYLFSYSKMIKYPHCPGSGFEKKNDAHSGDYHWLVYVTKWGRLA